MTHVAGSGDKLASGQRTAQFSTGGSAVDEPVELLNVAPEEEQDLTKGITVIDRRASYSSEPVKKAEPKWPEKQYESFAPILDRVLVKRIAPDKNMELLEDGSIRDKRTGFVIPAKYRQHANIGVVLAVGEFMVMGGIKVPLSDVVKPGYRVMFGEYNAEKLKVPDEQVMAMCDAIQVEFEASEDLDVVRVQDIRGIYKPVEAESPVDPALKAFRDSYNWVDKLTPDAQKVQRKNEVLDTYAATGEVKPKGTGGLVFKNIEVPK